MVGYGQRLTYHSVGLVINQQWSRQLLVIKYSMIHGTLGPNPRGSIR